MAGTRRIATPLDAAECRRHRWRNRIHSVVLLGAIIGLFALCAVLLFGWGIALWLVAVWTVAVLFSPKMSPRLILSMYGARPLTPAEFPAGYDLLSRLAAKADLPGRLVLYYLPSATLNAFAVGSRGDAAIVVTDGMLRALSFRELAGVLAHEVSHVRNNDLWIMNLADSISRLTSLLAGAGIVALIVLLPLALVGAVHVSLLLVPLLVFTPTVGALLQLALSRSREYDADLDAAGLTGDPRSLASALVKIERLQAGPWERLLLPGRSVPIPSVLRTHPSSDERVARLLALEAPASTGDFDERSWRLPDSYPVVHSAPRWHLNGLWH